MARLTSPRWLAGVLLLLALTACGRTDAERETLARERETGYRGFLLPESLGPVDFTLTDQRGEVFTLRDRTAGRLTLLFFGYTHCPDICPVHLANLAAVLEDLPYQTARRIQVVFVTTDPERDDAARLLDWLGRIDRSFVGLTGTPEAIAAAQTALALPEAVRMPPVNPERPDDYAVGHASQVIAIDGDGRARAIYPSGTRQAAWLHDLPRLVSEFVDDDEPPPEAGSLP